MEGLRSLYIYKHTYSYSVSVTLGYLRVFTVFSADVACRRQLGYHWGGSPPDEEHYWFQQLLAWSSLHLLVGPAPFSLATHHIPEFARNIIEESLDLSGWTIVN